MRSEIGETEEAVPADFANVVIKTRIARRRMDRLPLFVFGTLRQGEENHRYLAGRFERVLEATLPDFRRETTAHGFPAATPAPGESIGGELFFFNPYQYDAVLRDCDELEDLPPGKLVGEFYQRARVSVETSEGRMMAWAYIDPTNPKRSF